MTLYKQDNVPTDSELKSHLCVIGSGVVGLSVALEFAKKNPQKRVIVLESGYDKPGESQQATGGEIVGNDVYPLEGARIRAYGGTQWVWGGHSRPFDPIDFEKRDWVANSGWPIGYEEFAKYLEPATLMMDMDDPNWDNVHPKLNYKKLSNQEIFEHCQYKYSPQIVSTQPVDTGHFGQSHREELENQPNLDIYLDQTVIELSFTDEKSRVSSVVTRTLEGKRNTITADRFVLAAGGIENGRLMKFWFSQESSPTLPCDSVIGKYFMEHPVGDISHMFISPFQVKSYRHYAGFRYGSAVLQARLMITAEAQRKYQVNNQTFSLNKRAKKRAPEVPEGQALKAIVVAEQEPRLANKVELGTEKDIYGIPETVLHWSFSEQDYKSINFAAEQFPKFAGINNFGRARELIRKVGRNILGGHHHMGATRMASTAKEGVVDKNCKVFGLDNFYIAGGSVFSTGGSGNPTLNMVVFGQRLVDHLTQG